MDYLPIQMHKPYNNVLFAPACIVHSEIFDVKYWNVKKAQYLGIVDVDNEMLVYIDDIPSKRRCIINSVQTNHTRFQKIIV